MRKFIISFNWLLVFSSLYIAGCAPVQPWERGTLAKSQMALDPYPMLNTMRGHNYGSREAAASSGSSGGGGCGCY
ncbi:MAG: DUF4266 domain-containing protein [Methylococcaceae bacterium]|nr:DUF4266 domain-containing protein [Methylococcaceae bacterium]